MIVVGIDPSLTRTGVAVARDGAAAVGSVTSKPNGGGLVDTRDRIRFLVGGALVFAPRRIDLTVIEAPYLPRHGGGSVLERAWLYGLLVDQFLGRGPVASVPPAVRARYAGGAGNASKGDVLAAVRGAFPRIPLRNDDEADALALMAMGARHLGHPLDGEASAAQVAAMEKVAWPTGRKQG